MTSCTTGAGSAECVLTSRSTAPSGIPADASVLFESDSAAKRLASELHKMLKMAIKDKMGEPAMLDLEKKLKITAEGNMVKIAIRVTPQELEKNAQIYTATHKQPVPALAEVRAVAKPASACCALQARTC